MVNLLITGGAGFIGSNLSNYWFKNNPNDNLIILDKLTYAGNLKNLDNIINSSNRVNFIQGDICDKELIDSILRKFSISHVFNLAAESHVDRSIASPEIFIKTNVMGTLRLLESFKEYWEEKSNPSDYRFVHISTDEVYGSLRQNEKPFDEKNPYKPRSPYSASKASSDHLVKAWFDSYKLPCIISNCSNNYGPYHYPEKLIPLTIINILTGKNIPIYGSGMNIRDWLYVEDHCRALELIIKSNKIGESFCIGGSNEISNIELVKLICNHIDKVSSSHPIKPSNKLITFIKDRKGHDFRYSINSSKIRKDLNWKPKITFEKGIKETINWYLKNKDWWEPLLSKNNN